MTNGIPVTCTKTKRTGRIIDYRRARTYETIVWHGEFERAVPPWEPSVPVPILDPASIRDPEHFPWTGPSGSDYAVDDYGNLYRRGECHVNSPDLPGLVEQLCAHWGWRIDKGGDSS